MNTSGERFVPGAGMGMDIEIEHLHRYEAIAPKLEGLVVLDAACGTGGMLSTARETIMKMNPDADVQLFGQEVNPESYAICLADMMIKGQNAKNIR